MRRFACLTLAGILTTASALASPPMIGEIGTYRTKFEDSLLDIARDNDIGYVAMIAANPVLDPWVPGAGKDIVLPTAHILPDAPHEGIVVNVAEMRLYYYGTKDGVPETFPIGLGEEGSETPSGTTRVVRKQANPTWYRTKSEIAAKPWAPKIVPPGPTNPLGAFAIYLGWPAYLIHGTDDWRGVGRRDSRGCIRMYDEDIERLFNAVKIGTRVTVVNQPVKLAWVDDRLYLEVHPSPHQADQLEMDNVADFEDPAGVSKAVLAAANGDAARIDWTAVRQAATRRNGIPTVISR